MFFRLSDFVHFVFTSGHEVLGQRASCHRESGDDDSHCVASTVPDQASCSTMAPTSEQSKQITRKAWLNEPMDTLLVESR
jgi:hypothetical protein